MRPPADPLAAVTHPDPYPYYAELTERRPLHRDDELGLWVVASAETVTSVLQDERCRVRSPSEPVPKAVIGSPAGEIFRRLVRMTDGPGHTPLKRAVSKGLDAAAAHIGPDSRASASYLVSELTGGRLTLGTLLFQMPVHVIGTALGIPDQDLAGTARHVEALVRGFAPGASAEQLGDAGHAANELLGVVTRSRSDARPDGLLGHLRHEGSAAAGDDPGLFAANGVGLLTQGYEATAGLAGNALLALGQDDDLRQRLAVDPRRLRDFLLEVARHDPPVHNTRRWVAAEGVIAGQWMKEGDAILVVLAAANRDPAANPDPHRLDIDRSNRRSFTFGDGPHACPGESLAVSIAEAVLTELLATGGSFPAVRRPVAYRPSLNCRIPLL